MDKLSLRAYKCIVELNLHELTAPGVRLANKDDLYVNVCLLGQQRRTRLVSPVFPLKFSSHLVFEKTFKYARDEVDVVNFLNDLNVLVELIQLSRTEKNEVLAWYELNAKEFLYPDSNALPDYDSPQRGAFMTKNDSFPGSIAPQIIFCTSTRITESATPSLDILKEYENRFVNDPIVAFESKKSRQNKKRSKLTHFAPLDNFANHTISSAIKADYTLPDVQQKLEELNRSVQKTKIVKTNPGIRSAKIFQSQSFRPFVVRKADEKTILRKPELHDVLHDGLILTKKSPKRIHESKRARSRPSSRSRSASTQSRMTRSLSPISFNRSLNKSLNENLAVENYRPQSRKSQQNFDDLTLEPHEHLGSKNNCEVCLDHEIRSNIQSRANRLANSSSIFSRVKSPFNETVRLNSDELARASFLDQYTNKASFKEAHEMSQKLINKYRNANKTYPKSGSLSHYAPPSDKLDWQYARYYPWLFNYTEYLRDLEDELFWLKQRSKNLRIY
ncbi:unnamed protein product [Brachionus calyciflorus]|uniref:Spermatogenesis-associated protein 6 N-terminal domain-containing protein n=1 Tax=Brachionus calyciflorus TaxID=104777 RepID=A0A813Y238_9BILA|nr:unnamed protein product [Brachionus calyciflorus]